MTDTPEDRVVLPTREDPVAVRGSELIGGPEGRRARATRHWWTAVRALVLLGLIAYAVGFLLDLSCVVTGWASPERYEHLCYSDIPPLYTIHGFDRGLIPYIQSGTDHPLEYPVLTGVFMYIAAAVTTGIKALIPAVNAPATFFDVNVVLLAPFVVMLVAATALTVRRRPWDAAMVALSPGLILAATINWDLLAVGLTALAMMLWARKRPAWAGMVLGLAIAAKFYPVIILGPLLILCLRAGRLRAFGTTVLTAAAAWLVVNLPFMVLNFDGWVYFYTFSNTRGMDFGSFWYALYLLGAPYVLPQYLNLAATGTFLLLCVGIAWLTLAAARRPRFAQVAFLVVAAFCLTNKVYSPQYVLWLIPLAVMARPKWRDFLIWQVGEVAYFIAVWWYLAGVGIEDAKGMTQQWYAFFILVHIGFTIWFSALVVRDILKPDRDLVRIDGWPEDRDDPGGGVLDGAPDRFTLRRRDTDRDAEPDDLAESDLIER